VFDYANTGAYYGSMYISSKAKDDLAADNTMEISLWNPWTPNAPPAPIDWLSSDNLVVGGAFILMLNVVPSKPASADVKAVAQKKWSITLEFGEVKMIIDAHSHMFCGSQRRQLPDRDVLSGQCLQLHTHLLRPNECGDFPRWIWYDGVQPTTLTSDDSVLGTDTLLNTYNFQIGAQNALNTMRDAVVDECVIYIHVCLRRKRFFTGIMQEQAERIYVGYKQHLISALKICARIRKKSQAKNYAIINAKDHIKDTIIGTVASIISRSPIYSEGTIIVALAYNEDKIKVFGIGFKNKIIAAVDAVSIFYDQAVGGERRWPGGPEAGEDRGTVIGPGG
jgi:hypothetical protein